MPKGDDFHIEPAQQATEGDLARQNMQEKINLGYVSNAFEFDSQSKTGIFSLTIDPARWRRRFEAWVIIVNFLRLLNVSMNILISGNQPRRCRKGFQHKQPLVFSFNFYSFVSS